MSYIFSSVLIHFWIRRNINEKHLFNQQYCSQGRFHSLLILLMSPVQNTGFRKLKEMCGVMTPVLDVRCTDKWGVRHPRGTESLRTLPLDHTWQSWQGWDGESVVLEVTGDYKWQTWQRLHPLWLPRSLSVYMQFSACPFAYLPVALQLCASVCQSVCSLQSNVLLTLNVISFLTTLSLFSPRFQQSINNPNVKSKLNIITALAETWGRPYFNYLIAWTTLLKGYGGSVVIS